MLLTIIQPPIVSQYRVESEQCSEVTCLITEAHLIDILGNGDYVGDSGHWQRQRRNWWTRPGSRCARDRMKSEACWVIRIKGWVMAAVFFLHP